MNFKSTNHHAIKPKCPLCSYCGDKMNFIASKVKRPVPQGAEDLGIYDATHYWQCQRCNNTSTKFLSKCECGCITIDCLAYEESSPKKKITDNDEGGLYGYLLDHNLHGERAIDNH